MNRAALPLPAAESPAERLARRRVMALAVLAAALIGAAAGVLDTKGLL